jgi:hypothetical protein
MSFIKTKDGAEIYLQGLGGRPGRSPSPTVGC